jgi:heptosyltransferase-2
VNTEALLSLLKPLVAIFPRSWALWLGCHFGMLFCALDRKHRRAAKANLMDIRAAGRPPGSISRLVRQSFAYQGIRFVEFLRIEKYSRRGHLGYLHLRGKANAEDALARRKGVVYLTSHLGNPELTGTVLRALGYPCVEAVSPEMKRRYSRVLSPDRLRKQIAAVENEKAKAQLMARLRDNEGVCIAIDGNAGAGWVQVGFLGRPAPASTLPAELAIKTGAAVLPTFLLLDKYNRHILVLDRPLNVSATSSFQSDLAAATAALCKAIERCVRRYPAQWPWTYNAWPAPQNPDVRKSFRGVRRIVIKMPNWLGDAVMSLPAIEYLRRLFPHAYLTGLAKETVADIARNCRLLDSVIGYDHGSGVPALWRKARTIRRVRREFFDLAVLFTNSFESALWIYRAGIPLRVGYKGEGRSFLLTHARRRKPFPVRQIEEYLDLCRALGKADDSTVPRIHIPSRDRKWAEDFLGSLGFSADDLLIGLCPGAAYGPAKRWLAGRFIELSSRIGEERPVKVIVFGGKGDEEPCSTVADGIGLEVVNLCGKTTLRQLAALLDRCALVVANDSGSLHLAAAIGTQVIGIFGPTDPQRNAPPENCTVVKKDIQCSPCYKRECPTDLKCMTAISVEEVYQEAAAILSGNKVRPAAKAVSKRKT